MIFGFKDIGYNVRENQGKLMVYYANEGNQGQYECFLPNGQSSMVTLKVRDPPLQNDNDNNDNYDDYTPPEDYAVRAYVSKGELRMRYGSSDENTCTGMTNGNSMEIQWYNSRGEVRRIVLRSSTYPSEPF